MFEPTPPVATTATDSPARSCAPRRTAPHGNDDPLRPPRAEQHADPTTKSYLEAFAKLEAGDPGAMAAFAAHVGKHADDQLASFHLKRLLNGASGTQIVMD